MEIHNSPLQIIDFAVLRFTFDSVFGDSEIEEMNIYKYPVEVDLHNSKDHPLKAGMFAHVIFNSISKSKSLIIPRDALLGSVKNAQVFLVQNGVVKLKDLVLGNSSNNNLEVLSGLNSGDVVVVNGQNNLKDNYKVKVVN